MLCSIFIICSGLVLTAWAHSMFDLLLYYGLILAHSFCYFYSSCMSWRILGELGSVMVNAWNLLSRPLESHVLPFLLSWISLKSANHLCCKASSSDGLFYLFFSSSFFTKSWASGEMVSHGEKEKSGASWIVCLAISLSSSSSNGRTLLSNR